MDILRTSDNVINQEKFREIITTEQNKTPLLPLVDLKASIAKSLSAGIIYNDYNVEVQASSLPCLKIKGWRQQTLK